jgi:FKBP-type peptidyl-prolyl cis-trans isomerase
VTRALALLACAALLAGCKHFDLQQRPAPVDRDEIRTTRGVTYKDLFRGQSACAGIGDEVLLDYTLFLQDGTRVDSTLDRGVPVRVVIGDAFVRGLDDGLFGICPGGRRRITVPPDLGYGEQGVPGLVPPHATLVFEVHAIEVHPGRK